MQTTSGIHRTRLMAGNAEPVTRKNCKGGGPADVIDKEKIYAYMPSDFLIQHEWDTHGTCSGLARSAYFDLTGNLSAS